MNNKDIDIQHNTALFDMDGVIFDTEPQYTVFWGNICREYRQDIEGLELLIKGQTLKDIFSTYFADQPDEQIDIVQRLNEYEKEMTYQYIPGAKDFLLNLKGRGVNTALVTSSNMRKMQQVYRQHPDFVYLFDKIFSSEDFKASKPNPDCYLTAAQHFNVSTKECVVFEDSINGLKSARAANMYVVALQTTLDKNCLVGLCDEIIRDFSNYTFK